MKIRLGTRASNLALIQANDVKKMLEQNKDIKVEIVKISTKGDRIQNVPIDKIEGRGVFVKEIEKQLLEKNIDLAVHSMKDMPSLIVEGLYITKPPKAQSPEDVFIGNSSIKSLSDLKGKTIGTSSNRRKSQIKKYVGDVKIESIRGNIETRIKKISTQNLDGIFLAKAGIIRGGYQDKIGFICEPTIMIPSPCQGILALQVREDDKNLIEEIEKHHDQDSAIRMNIERTYQKSLSATCSSPIGIYTKISGNSVTLYGCYSPSPEKDLKYEKISGDIKNCTALAQKLANKLKED